MDRSRVDLARGGFVAAAVAGVVHALFSVYWGLGGDVLLDTVGEVADAFAGRRRLLCVVGIAKGAAAVVPLVIFLRCRRIPCVLRGAMWAGAGVLVLWGAVNTVSSALLAAGILARAPETYDRTATLGHALLWDPLFLVWGLALVAGLWATRTNRSA
ncbi:DUF3995 domain-containing protein [Tsukamurella ocularis]|uniref:DUF3995 domain-containing protein n=1 Tax=Tsukamurella ocularis TaxID=1970234 RepID=UPI0039EFCFD4